MPPPSNFSFLAKHSRLSTCIGATAKCLFPVAAAGAAWLGSSLHQPTLAELLMTAYVRQGKDGQARLLFRPTSHVSKPPTHEVTARRRRKQFRLSVHRLGSLWGFKSVEWSEQLRGGGADEARDQKPGVSR